MEWIQTLTIIGSLIGLTFIFFNKLDEVNARNMDNNARIDRLYQLILDILKERK